MCAPNKPDAPVTSMFIRVPVRLFWRPAASLNVARDAFYEVSEQSFLRWEIQLGLHDTLPEHARILPTGCADMLASPYGTVQKVPSLWQRIAFQIPLQKRLAG